MIFTNDADYIIFSKNLGKAKELLDILSDNAYEESEYSICNKRIYNVGGQHLVASINTLQSVELCCERGHFSDAYALARKYRDDLLQYLFIIETLNSKTDFADEDTEKLFDEPIDIEKVFAAVMKFADVFYSGARKNERDRAVDAFLDNSLAEQEKQKCRREYFDASKYIFFLKKNKHVSDCFDFFFADVWREMDRTLNNYVHANGMQYIFSNLPQFSNIETSKRFDEILKIIMNTTTMFLAILILIEPNYIMSSDYIDCLECNIPPVIDSQYWVASGIQEYIDEFVVGIDPKLKEYLRDLNPSGMKIE